MKKYAKIWSIILRNCINKNLTYRLEFATGFITDLCFCLVRILFVEVLFLNVNQIGQWNRSHFMVFFGSSFIIEGIYMFLFFNSHTNIPKQVSTGEMDFLLAKPVSEIFYISMNSLNLGSGVSNLLIGGVYLSIGLKQLGLSIGLERIAAYVVMLIVGITLYFWMSFIINVISFWIIEVNSIFNIFTNIMDFYRYPCDMFPNGIKIFITYIFPFQFIAIIPAQVLIGSMSLRMSLISIGISILLTVIGHVFYKFARKSYVGANC